MLKITIIGTGYVGLVSGAGISDFGHTVTCVDISSEKIELLNSGKIPIYEPGLGDLIEKNVGAGRLTFSTDIVESIKSAEIIFIAVGTPQSSDGSADLSSVQNVARIIGKNINSDKVICTKSTVPVGTGNWIVEQIGRYNENNFKIDYVSNPEFLREGSAVKDFLWPDRVVIGSDNNHAFDIMKDVYSPLYINKKPIIHTSVVTAEMIKYASNSFLALKISYINEVANLCDELGADVHKVAKAMGRDGRISPKFLHPGPGFGGSCFPKDIKAFAKLASQNKLTFKTVEAAIKANESQKKRMVEKLRDLIGGNFKGKSVAILGLAFKPNTDDVRESPAIYLIDIINEEGGNIKAYDPISNDNMKLIYPDLEYCSNWQEACKNADAVALITEWNEFRSINLKVLSSLLKVPAVLDARNIFDISKLKENNLTYRNFGRQGF
tara:strand:+ start:301 stop:1614 length:1314 start_codon:yes stop_codon:yes gene_type:complete